jgi:hypothetical protein
LNKIKTMSKKIQVEERIHMPGAVAPRVMVWLAALVAAPLTGGASLAGVGIYEAGIAKERRRAADEIDRHCSLENDAESINQLIGDGAKRASVKSTHYLGHLGLGSVTRETTFTSEDEASD